MTLDEKRPQDCQQIKGLNHLVPFSLFCKTKQSMFTYYNEFHNQSLARSPVEPVLGSFSSSTVVKQEVAWESGNMYQHSLKMCEIPWNFEVIIFHALFDWRIADLSK
jgi:hypothetical protein